MESSVKKKSLRIFAAALAVTLTAAACGSDDPETVAAQTSDTVAEVADDAMEDDAMEDDAMEDDAMEDDAMEDDAMEDDAMEDDAMEDDAMEDDAMEDDAMADDAHVFTVTITNTSEGATTPTPLAPGVAVSSASPDALFTAGAADFGAGLEALAEDGDPSGYADVDGAVIFNTPDGAAEPGPALPGSSYSFEIEGRDGYALFLATMFVQSNDWFWAPDGAGIPFYDEDGEPLSGDITQYFQLWDSGTEIDQEPGTGADQAPRQAGPDTGDADPDTAVRTVDRDAANYIQVTVEVA